MSRKIVSSGLTDYSAKIAGDRRNYKQVAQFDLTDGYLGISTQFPEGGTVDRVLLSPRQVKALVAFVAPPPKRKRRP